MKEVIILEVSESQKSQLIQDFLKQKKIDYRILAETPQKVDIFANYGEAIKGKEREQELRQWDNVDL